MCIRDRLEGEKYEAEQQKPQFLEILKEVEALNREKKGKKDSLDELREKIRVASDEKARQMLQNQLKGLKADIEQNQQSVSYTHLDVYKRQI